MRADKKLARAMEKFIAQASQAGHDLSQFTQHKETIVEESRGYKHRPSPYMEAEAVLRCLEKPGQFEFKLCKREECREPFGTNYRAVAYCSDHCRSKDLQKTGIRWDPTKSPEERWGGEPPLIIPPAAVRTLIHALSALPESLSGSLPQPDEFSADVSLPNQDEQDNTIPPERTSPQVLEQWEKGPSVFDL